MIYLDNAATTRTLPEAVKAMEPFLNELYGNASAVYGPGQQSRAFLMKFRRDLADLCGADRDEIFFTSGGSESDNWALEGAVRLFRKKNPGKVPHIITTKIEHHAVLKTAGWLEECGAEVTYLDVDKEGFVRPEDVEGAIRDNTALISVMMANNEIGTIEPVSEIGRIARQHAILFHTDAVQAFGQIPVDVRAMNIDMLSASSHKLYGPKGAGLLYIRKGILLPSLIHGGGQERGRRAGTENLPGIAGFAKAARAAQRDMEKRMTRETHLRDLMIAQIREKIGGVCLNGPEPSPFRLPGNVNFAFDDLEGESLLVLLDMEGVCASSGSACSSGSLDPSHVLLAIGKKHNEARSSLRFSIGAFNTEEEIIKTTEILHNAVEKLRAHT